MSLLRLAVVTETYLPDVNGVATSLQQLLRALVKQDVALQIIRVRSSQLSKTSPAYLPEFDEIQCPSVALPFYPDLRLGLPSQSIIRRSWQTFRPDIVYVATEGPLGFSALREAKAMGIPVISAFHTNFHQYSGYYGQAWLSKWVLNWLRYFHNRTSCTLVPAADIAETLIAQQFERILVFPHGVNSEQFHPRWRSTQLRVEWGADATTPVLLSVGRLAQEKNLPLLLRTWQQIKVHYPRCKLVLVGDGPLRHLLAKDDPDLIIAGVRKGAELSQYYASADLFLFPSQSETFGLVTLEAMASGLPVVAYNMAAAKQFVQSGYSGELAHDMSDKAFLDATLRMLEQPLAEVGLRARQMAEQNSWDQIARNFLTLCLPLLHKPLEPQAC